jgi:hypothetical protein
MPRPRERKFIHYFVRNPTSLFKLRGTQRKFELPSFASSFAKASDDKKATEGQGVQNTPPKNTHKFL